MNTQVIDSYDQHVEDCSPQWPVSYGVFEKVALSIMDADSVQKYKSALFVMWMELHVFPNSIYAEKVWEKMKADIKKGVSNVKK